MRSTRTLCTYSGPACELTVESLSDRSKTFAGGGMSSQSSSSASNTGCTSRRESVSSDSRSALRPSAAAELDATTAGMAMATKNRGARRENSIVTVWWTIKYRCLVRTEQRGLFFSWAGGRAGCIHSSSDRAGQNTPPRAPPLLKTRLYYPTMQFQLLQFWARKAARL